MAKKTPASTENSEDSAQDLQQSAKKTVMPQADVAPQAGSTLPFAQPRDVLINKFRANAVPREADYKQLLDQHYDIAGALGIGNSEDNNGGTTGNGLVFESASGKLQVKANTTGGLTSDESGISMVPGKTLVINASSNVVDVKINGKNGLKFTTEGEVGVSLYSYNADSDSASAAVINNNNSGAAGIWINVGTGSSKKGLKQYPGPASSGAVLGVSYDGTLKIDSSTGKLGVNTTNLPVNGVTSPLDVSSGKVSINYDSTLSVTSGKLGVSIEAAVPKGTIVMFSGTAVPKGWALCNGQTVEGVKTPDLVNMFIRGAGTVSTSGTRGGADNYKYAPSGGVIVTGHKLTIDQMPYHRHQMNLKKIKVNQGTGYEEIFHAAVEQQFFDSFVTTYEGGGFEHSHLATFSGNEETIQTLPSYYTLAYIMKI